MKRGCPDCAVTQLYDEFIEELKEELALLAEQKDYCEQGRGAEYKWPWSVEKLISDVNVISGFNARLDGKGHDPKWTVAIRNLVEILRQENFTQDRIDRDERQRELDSLNVNGGRSSK